MIDKARSTLCSVAYQRSGLHQRKNATERASSAVFIFRTEHAVPFPCNTITHIARRCCHTPAECASHGSPNLQPEVERNPPSDQQVFHWERFQQRRCQRGNTEKSSIPMVSHGTQGFVYLTASQSIRMRTAQSDKQSYQCVSRMNGCTIKNPISRLHSSESCNGNGDITANSIA